MTKRNRREAGFIRKSFRNLKDETVQGVLAVLFFMLAIFFALAFFNKAGFIGEKTFIILQTLVGTSGYVLLPILLTALGISFLKSLKKNIALTQSVGAIIFFFSGLGIIGTVFVGKGGIFGKLVSIPLIKLFDTTVTLIILSALLIICALVMFDAALNLKVLLLPFRKKKIDEKDPKKELEKEADVVIPEVMVAPEEKPEMKKDVKPKKSDDFMSNSIAFASLKPYAPPPLSLLEVDKGKPGVGDIKANSNIIKRTLMNFGIDVEMDEISIGPSVTRYALKPAEGVKLSKIVGLQNDLSLALAAHPIRIEAPIPGKSLVGIEIPNSVKTTVGLGTILGSEEFQQSDKSLLISLGKIISGKANFGNLAKMPHLLIAGATGSGKSVTIHAIITSLLYRNSPENLKFIMIDPKRVELTLYNKIPHLLTPVITDPKKAILALKWAAKEMDRRYDVLEKEHVRDIESYHKNVLSTQKDKIKDGEERKETMPYTVIIIDELADIMQSYPRELESAIVRLAQMSRAVGIHLILSTQRPSVNVITGLIKANVPTRIALQVTSQIDSRTILDTGGAEKLLGAGDMLYLSGEMAKPQRIQSPYISENEVKNVVKYLVDAYKDEIPEGIDITAAGARENNPLFEGSIGNDEDAGDDDELYEEAREIVIHAGKASTSYLQRKLRIGYARAARLIDMLEERGVIGAGEGAKPREVIGASGGESNEAVDEEVV